MTKESRRRLSRPHSFLRSRNRAHERNEACFGRAAVAEKSFFEKVCRAGLYRRFKNENILKPESYSGRGIVKLCVARQLTQDTHLVFVTKQDSTKRFGNKIHLSRERIDSSLFANCERTANISEPETPLRKKNANAKLPDR